MIQTAKEYTTIKISVELRDKLKAIGHFGDSYEDVIWRLAKVEPNPVKHQGEA